MHSSTSLVIAAFTLTISACGGSSGSSGSGKVEDKKSAAGAAYDVQRTGDDVHNRSAGGLRAQQLGDLPGDDGVSASNSVTIPGQTGQAIVTESADITSGSVSAVFTIKYESFSLDGKTTYNGQVEHRVEVTSGEVKTALNGSVTLTGAIESSLDMNVSVSITSGSIALEGAITADGMRYDYAGDDFSLDEVDDFERLE